MVSSLMFNGVWQQNIWKWIVVNVTTLQLNDIIYMLYQKLKYDCNSFSNLFHWWHERYMPEKMFFWQCTLKLIILQRNHKMLPSQWQVVIFILSDCVCGLRGILYWSSRHLVTIKEQDYRKMLFEEVNLVLSEFIFSHAKWCDWLDFD